MWLVPLSDLTDDQRIAVEASTAQHRVIVGGPGSGKTLVLVHRAQKLILAGMPPERVKVLVFTNVLKEYLREGLQDLGLVVPGDANSMVATFDSWVRGLYTKYVTGPIPKTGVGPDYGEIRARVLVALKSRTGGKLLDAVLVDEGQDLPQSAIEILAEAAAHVTLAMDSRQQLYDVNTDVESVCSTLGVRRASAVLLSAYRCTPLIVELAASFLPDAQEAQRFRRASLQSVAGVETPLVVVADGDESELDHLAQCLKDRILAGETTAVLAQTNRQVTELATGLRKRDVDVATAADLDLGSLRPMALTYYMAKGLTVDAVFLPGLTNASFQYVSSETRRKHLLFVGVTRAIRWAWLGMRESGSLPELDVVSDLAAKGIVKLMPVGQAAVRTPVPAAAPRPTAAPVGSLADLL